jgi:hypothetical protein
MGPAELHLDETLSQLPSTVNDDWKVAAEWTKQSAFHLARQIDGLQATVDRQAQEIAELRAR